MSEMPDPDDQLQAVADKFDRERDPLAKHATHFELLAEEGTDPFEIFISKALDSRNIVETTRKGYKRVFRQWREHMTDEGRHPACPNEAHVKRFIRYELEEKDNHPDTVKEKLRKLNDAYTFWQAKNEFPHPQNYNPIQTAKSETAFESPDEKDVPRLSIDELREVIQDVTHIRNRAIIVLQLKLGLRATEVCNIQLSELSISNHELQRHYPELGGHRMLENRENVIYIPHDREGNKSERPRLLPLDDETRRVLIRYLLIRPDNGEPWVFLSSNNHAKLGKEYINRPWKEAFHPEYEETEQYRAVTSHYGRHRFTTYWRVEQDLNRELIQYMRGDTNGSSSIRDRGAIDEYIHTYFEDIEGVYLENIYKLGI